MRIGLIAHGVLATAALLFAYQTWTRDKEEKPKVGDYAVWSKGAVKGMVYESENKTIRIEKRSDDSGDYLWGSLRHTRNIPKAPPMNPHGAPPTDPHGHGAPPAAPTNPHAAPGNPHAAPAQPATPPAKPAPAKPVPAKTAPAKPAPAKPAPAKTAPAKPAPAKPASGGPDSRLGTGGPQQPAADKPAPTKPAAATPAKPAPAKPAPAKPAPAAATPAKPAPAAATPTKPAPAKPAAKATPATAPTAPEAAAQDATSSPATAEPEKSAEPIVTTREFPVGEKGEMLLEQFASLHAMRDLGKLDEEKLKEYELSDSKISLTILFEDGSQRTLVIGKKVYRGADRFVLDPESDQAFVLSGELMKPFDSGESGLALKKFHDFNEDELGGVVIKTAKGEREFSREETEEEGKKRVVWSDKKNPTENDQTVGNFLGRLFKLKPSEYNPELKVTDLVHLTTVRYFNAHNKELGFVELYRQLPETQEVDKTGKRQTQYFIVTEHTHSLGKVSRLSAERVDQDVVEIFGIDPAPGAIDDSPKMPGQIPEGPTPAPGQEDAKGTGAKKPVKVDPKKMGIGPALLGH